VAEPLRPARTARRGAPPIQQTGRSAPGGPWALLLGALLGALLALTAAPARAAEPGATFSLAGDLKQFFFATLPYDHPLMPPDPTGQGLLDLRLKGGLRAGPVRAEVHPERRAGRLNTGQYFFGRAEVGAGGEARGVPIGRVQKKKRNPAPLGTEFACVLERAASRPKLPRLLRKSGQSSCKSSSSTPASEVISRMSSLPVIVVHLWMRKTRRGSRLCMQPL
jgi:hypothetical protein